jgi:hypothetical protein
VLQGERLAPLIYSSAVAGGAVQGEPPSFGGSFIEARLCEPRPLTAPLAAATRLQCRPLAGLHHLSFACCNRTTLGDRHPVFKHNREAVQCCEPVPHRQGPLLCEVLERQVDQLRCGLVRGKRSFRRLLFNDSIALVRNGHEMTFCIYRGYAMNTTCRSRFARHDLWWKIRM